MKTLERHVLLSALCLSFTHHFVIAQPNQPGSGNCLLFDGVDDYVKVPTLTWTPTSFSVEWWLFPLSNSNWNQAIVAANGWGAFVFHSTNTNAVYVGTDISTRFTPADIPSNTVILNSWQHFTFTFDNGAAKFYRNGILLASKTGMTNPVNWAGFYISEGNPINAINGFVDEVRIWNYARSQSEIRRDMCRKLQGNEPGLVGYWRLDEGSGTTAFDSSPNGNDGTLY